METIFADTAGRVASTKEAEAPTNDVPEGAARLMDPPAGKSDTGLKPTVYSTPVLPAPV